MRRRLVVLDFETEGIRARPEYPPRPVGLAVLDASSRRRGVYHAWGHREGNNTTPEAVGALLRDLWLDEGVDLLFHNSKFDVDVAQETFKLPALPWRRCHDTLFQLYLHDPRAPSLSLKPSAERLLGTAPEERDAVREWLVSHGVVKANQKDWGAFICEAPPRVVGPYALGDVTRTLALHRHLLPLLTSQGMLDAYDRERRLMPILLENERLGIHVDLERLRVDVERAQTLQDRAAAWLRRRLAAPALNLDAPEEVADALERAGLVIEWVYTEKGARSTALKNLRLNEPETLGMLTLYSKVSTAVDKFMLPWLTVAERSGGRIFTNWNQVRGENDKGTRTGRLSSNPNLQNLSNPFEGELVLPRAFKGSRIPEVKEYVLPDPGETMGSRDYSQQELRVMGHFEDGPLLEAYQANPRMDIHEHARVLINDILGTDYGRKPIKTVGFGLIYGMGKDLLAEQMGLPVEVSSVIKRTYLEIFPGLRNLDYDLKRQAKLDQPIRTWGGRVYYVEEPRVVKGRLRTFEYKLLNILVQGSSADCTKEAICRYYERRTTKHGRFLALVHDQVIISAPPRHLRRCMTELREAMESVEFDVKMLSDGSAGSSWANLQPVDY